MYLPREILYAIGINCANLFKTCKQFYEHVDIFYRNYNVDFEKNKFVLPSTKHHCLLKTNLNYKPDIINRIFKVTNFNNDIKSLPQNLTHLTFSKLKAL
jgi:hypothetical protein